MLNDKIEINCFFLDKKSQFAFEISDSGYELETNPIVAKKHLSRPRLIHKSCDHGHTIRITQ